MPYHEINFWLKQWPEHSFEQISSRVIVAKAKAVYATLNTIWEGMYTMTFNGTVTPNDIMHLNLCIEILDPVHAYLFLRILIFTYKAIPI